MYSHVSDTACSGSGCCESKQHLPTVNFKDDTLPEIVFAQFLDNLMVGAVGFLQINITWLQYNIAESLCLPQHSKINGNKVL